MPQILCQLPDEKKLTFSFGSLVVGLLLRVNLISFDRNLADSEISWPRLLHTSRVVL